MDLYIIDRDSDTPLYAQIRENIIHAIQSEKLLPGDRLPSVSNLAKEIGVTQATIRRALQDLGEAGHTECHVGRGTFIKEAATDCTTIEDSPQQVFNRDGHDRSTPLAYAARRLRSGVSKALYDIMPLAQKPGIIQLTRGIPDGSLLPPGFLEEVSSETLSSGSARFIEATDTLGMLELRREIARRFSGDGGTITPDQVLITNGSLQAVTLIAQAALENRPAVICETPCFQGIPDTFTAMGHWVETAPRDQEGPIMNRLNRLSSNGPALLYVCPYAHNPTGTDLSPERYVELTEWAKRSGSIIIADEIFKDLDFHDDARPSLFKALGGEQSAVVSSISKSVMTGLRLGWIISSPARIQQLAQLKRLMDHACPSLIQGLALTIFTSGRYDSHTSTMKIMYRERMETMLKSLQALMPKGVSWSRPDGGFSLMAELPRGYSSVALLLSAIDRGVSFLPGPLFDIDQRYVHALRLSTAWVDRHQIKEGIELLAGTIDEFLRQPPGDSGLSGLGNFQ